MIRPFILLWLMLFGDHLLVERARAQDRTPLVSDQRIAQYVATFHQQEAAATGKNTGDHLPWLLGEIPRVDLPDKAMEEMYYFRWYAFAKHVRKTSRGHVVTEFLEDVPWAGKYNTISAAASMHLYEARWLHDKSVAEEYAQFWTEKDAEPRLYSFPFADSVHALTLVTGDDEFEKSMLPSLIQNYQSWEADHLDASGLFWQIDDRDGMEFSAGGSGFRPTINSYMYADAMAISAIASAEGDRPDADQFRSKALDLADVVHRHLWNPEDSFYETVSKQNEFSKTRELVGFIPWLYGMARPADEVAWLQLNQPQGFLAPYGFTTAEQRSSQYLRVVDHECTWNGPVWPFAMTQTLLAMSNMLASPGVHVLKASDFMTGLNLYVKEQHMKLPTGEWIPWIDEDTHPETGEWLARSIMTSQDRPDKHRGAYYNHSGFADVLITGLFGVRPSTGQKLRIAPLVDPSWDYFALDGLPYHGSLITIVFDRTGSRYHLGKGLRIFQDGRLVAKSSGPSAQWVALKRDEVKVRSTQQALTRH